MKRLTTKQAIYLLMLIGSFIAAIFIQSEWYFVGWAMVLVLMIELYFSNKV
jgi:hypothetical protein